MTFSLKAHDRSLLSKSAEAMREFVLILFNCVFQKMERENLRVANFRVLKDGAFNESIDFY